MGNIRQTSSKIITLAGFCVALAGTASAAEIINVSLWDKGMTAPMATNVTYMAGMEMHQSAMGIKLSKATVKAGLVTFKVKNDSKDIVHEMLVLPITAETGPVVDAKEARIAEDTANSLGEVAETDPGKTGVLKLKLTPGKYLITCNIAGHYMNGMWTVLTVK